MSVYTVKAAKHLHTAERLKEIAEHLPQNALSRELDDKETLVLFAVSQLLMQVSVDEMKAAQSLIEESHDA
jgi:hypothetical protein